MRVKHFRIYQGTGFVILPQSQVELALNSWLATANDIEEVIYIYYDTNSDSLSNEWHNILVLYEEKKQKDNTNNKGSDKNE